MKLFFLSLLFAASTEVDAKANTVNDTCEVKIRADVSESIQNYPLIIKVDGKKHSVTAQSPEICVAREALDVYPRKFSVDSVGFYAQINNRDVMLYDARAHNQADLIQLSSVSTIANAACERECGYHEYRQLIQDPTVAKIAKEYTKQIIANKKLVADFPERRKIYAQLVAPINGIFDAGLPKVAALEAMPQHDRSYGVNPYSGAYLYWSKYRNLSQIFVDFVGSKKETVLKNANPKKLKPHFEPFEKELVSQIRTGEDWPIKKSKFIDIGQRMIKHKNQTIQNYGQMLIDSVTEIDDLVDNYLNSNRTDFKSLTFSNMPQQEVVANWYRNAYHYTDNADKFAALFTKQLRKKLYAEIFNNRKLDKSLSKIVSLYGRMSLVDSDSRAYQRILNEYQYAAAKQNNKIIVNDALEQLVFVYENGMWRLDAFNMLDF